MAKTLCFCHVKPCEVHMTSHESSEATPATARHTAFQLKFSTELLKMQAPCADADTSVHSSPQSLLVKEHVAEDGVELTAVTGFFEHFALKG